MNREPPQAADERTIIRPTPVREAPGQRSEAPVEPTIFSGDFQASGGWSEPTVIAGPASIGNAPSSGALDEVFAVRSADPGVREALVVLAAQVLLPLARLQATPAAGIGVSALHARFEAALENFHSGALAAGLQPDTVRLARRALAATVDDVVGHLPGTDAAAWRRLGLGDAAEARERRTHNFFEDLNRSLAAPQQHADLLELFYACLALGFQGQYRGRPGAEADLGGIRADVQQVLRHLAPPQVGLDGRSGPSQRTYTRRRSFGWIAVSGLVACLVLALGGMRIILSRDAQALEAELRGLVPSGPVMLAEVMPAAALPPEPVSLSRIDALRQRIQTELEQEIGDGSVVLTSSKTELAIEINNERVFAVGSADLVGGFASLASRLGSLLGEVDAPIRVVGYTDDVRPGKSSRFPSNQALSAARAEAVAKVLAQSLDEPDRLSFQGRGEADPVADNATAEGRARNRRVVIVLSREAGQ